MSNFTVQDLKAEMVGILHGTTLNQIADIDGVIYRAARQLMLDIDPQEQKRIVPLASPIFNQVYDYNLPPDIKGNRIIDIRPQVNRDATDFFVQSYNRDFDYSKSILQSPQFTVNFNTGIKTIRISDPLLNTGILLDSISEINSNGIWATGGDAIDLEVDNVNFVFQGGSLKFNLINAGSAGWLENSTMTALNLKQHENQSVIFTYVFLPTASDFTSINVRWGTDNANYWDGTATTDYQGNAFVDGWNLVGINWLGANKVGAPDATQIKYGRITYNYNGTQQTACRANSFTSQLGVIWQIEYYSKYMFQDAITSGWQEKITDDSNLINLDTESYSLMVNLVAIYTAQQQQGYSALQFDYKFFQGEYDKGVARYRSLYKSEVEMPKSTYYQKPNAGYSRWAGTRFVR